MKKTTILILVICFMLFSIYNFSQIKYSDISELNTNDVMAEDTNDLYIIKDELINEIDKENDSLIKENKELREEIIDLKKKLNLKDENKLAKFYPYTDYYSFYNRYHSSFNEDRWNSGSNFKVDGKVFNNGIGFNRDDNGNRSYFLAKLYNENGNYSNLFGYIGVDDLAEDLMDSEVTFKVFNNDDIIKCNNEYYGEEIFRKKFKKSEGIKEINIDLKGANNIIIEFSTDKDSNLNYFLLLNPELH